MKTPRVILAMGLGFCSATSTVGVASAQVSLPAAKQADGAALFRQQCATCHTTNASDPPRQGPTLFNIVGREAGTAEGFRYSAGFATAKFKWDEQRLDAWLTDPQAIIPSAVMPYTQSRSEIRTAIVSYLEELH
jgi:cytochrome c